MNRDAGYEVRDAHPRPILWLTGALVVVCVVAFWAMGWLEDDLVRTESAGERHPLAPAGPTVPPAPRLQVQAQADLEALHRREDALLGQYAWVDPEAGLVRVPIERAIELLLAEGAPAAAAAGEDDR